MTDQSKDTAKVQLGEPVSLLGYPQEQIELKNSCTTKAHQSMPGRSAKLETWGTLYNLQAAQKGGECPFYVVQLVSASFSQLS